MTKLLIDNEITEHSFMSTGVAKGKDFATKKIILNLYMPKETETIYNVKQNSRLKKLRNYTTKYMSTFPFRQ